MIKDFRYFPIEKFLNAKNFDDFMNKEDELFASFPPVGGD